MTKIFVTDAGDTIVTVSGDTLIPTNFISNGGGQVRGQGFPYLTSSLWFQGRDTIWFVTPYINGVRQKPPTNGGVVSAYIHNVSWLATTSSFRFITTSSDDYLVTDAGDYIMEYTRSWGDGAVVLGTPVLGVVIWPDPVYGAARVKDPHPILYPASISFLITSHIRSMDFIPDDSGEVRKITMPWYGFVLNVLKLGNMGVVVYGQNGINLLSPRGTDWGQKPILGVGIKGPGAACVGGDEKEHFFIDNNGFFYILGENLQKTKIDFSNYFSALTSSVVMSYDPLEDTVYIADGIRGFIWSRDGLGNCPVNITGIGNRAGDFFVTGSSTITPDPFNICTGVLDFGVRTEKKIEAISLGINLTNDIYGAIDYRWRTDQTFVTTPWVKADRSGMINVRASGVEFRIGIKLLTYEDIQLDYSNLHVFYDDLKPLGDMVARQ